MRKLVILLVLATILVFIPIASAETFTDSTEDDFNSGGHDKTYWSDNGYIKLGLGNETGTFTSRVFEADYESIWQRFVWGETYSYGDALPDDEENIGDLNMTGNVLLYHLDETSGTNVADSSGNGFDGTNVQYVEVGQSGRFSNSYYFDKDGGNLISIPSSVLNEKTNFTFEAWFKTVDGGTQALVSGANATSNNQFLIYFTSSTKVSLYLEGTNYAHTITSISDGQWHHIVWTRYAVTALQTLYFDGNVVGTNSVPVTPLDIDVGGLVLGEEQDSVGGSFDINQSFEGNIDEVAFYDRALNEEEVLTRYKRGIMEIKFQMRSDDDNSNWGVFEGPDGSQYTYFTTNDNTDLIVDNNKYFQYKAYFSTENGIYSPQLENVSIEYEFSNQPPTQPLLTSPENGSLSDELSSIALGYSSTDSENQDITYYVYVYPTSGSQLNETNLIYTGLNEYTSFLPTAFIKYYWKVIANDGIANSFPSKEGMFEFKEDITQPVINNEEINENITEGQIVTVTANITDEHQITALLNVKNPSSVISVYSMSNQAGLWKAIFIAGEPGSYQFKVNASDNFDNSNNGRQWIDFTISTSPVCDSDDICEQSEGETYENCAADCCQENQTKACGSNIGACLEGERSCQTNGNWGVCVNETGPVNEICNNIDDDCDSQIDEDLECDECSNNETKACGSNVGACEEGSTTCYNGHWGQCTGGQGSVSEILDLIDNDCDGEMDEGCVCSEGEMDICGSNIGACEYGASTCENCQWGACKNNIGPAEETCNNDIDDDCDGETDTDCQTEEEVIIPPEGEGSDETPEGGLFGQEPFGLPPGSWAILIAAIVMAIIGIVVHLKSKKGEKKSKEQKPKKEDSKKKEEPKQDEPPKEIPKELPKEPPESEGGDELIITGQLKYIARKFLHRLQELQKINKK
ncbi:MAG: LamG domain-containing protein [Nanoarchaeota archaeon]